MRRRRSFRGRRPSRRVFRGRRFGGMRRRRVDRIGTRF